MKFWKSFQCCWHVYCLRYVTIIWRWLRTWRARARRRSGRSPSGTAAARCPGGDLSVDCWKCLIVNSLVRILSKLAKIHWWLTSLNLRHRCGTCCCWAKRRPALPWSESANSSHPWQFWKVVNDRTPCREKSFKTCITQSSHAPCICIYDEKAQLFSVLLYISYCQSGLVRKAVKMPEACSSQLTWCPRLVWSRRCSPWPRGTRGWRGTWPGPPPAWRWPPPCRCSSWWSRSQPSCTPASTAGRGVYYSCQRTSAFSKFHSAKKRPLLVESACKIIMARWFGLVTK